MSTLRPTAIAASAATVLLAACALGCAHREAYGMTTLTSAPAPSSPPKTPKVEDEFVPSSIALYVAEQELPDLCGGRATMIATHFDRGAAEIPPFEYLGLRELGRCLTTGPLGSSRVRLVGQTEPRESADPLELGLERAVHVKQVLMAEGVDARRIDIASEGDTRARSEDPGTWPAARRVDVLIQRPPLTPPPFP